VLWLGVLAACPSPRAPSTAGGVAAATVEIGRAGSLLAGVAGNGVLVFAALTAHGAAPTSPPATAAAAPAANAPSATTPAIAVAATTIEALRPSAGASAVWQAELAGYGGPLVVAGTQLVAALGGSGSVAGLALRGEPGAAVVALDAATGAPAWKLAIDATEWAVIAALSATSDGIVVGGSFSGTLRIADKVLSSAGRIQFSE